MNGNWKYKNERKCENKNVSQIEFENNKIFFETGLKPTKDRGFLEDLFSKMKSSDYIRQTLRLEYNYFRFKLNEIIVIRNLNIVKN